MKTNPRALGESRALLLCKNQGCKMEQSIV